MGKSTGFRYAGKGPGLQKKSKLARKYLPKSGDKVKGGQMNSLDWGVESVSVPKHLVQTGLKAPVVTSAVEKPDLGDSSSKVPSESLASASATSSAVREPKTLAEKFGIQALKVKIGDRTVEQTAKEKAEAKTAMKRLKKCSPV